MATEQDTDDLRTALQTAYEASDDTGGSDGAASGAQAAPAAPEGGQAALGAEENNAEATGGAERDASGKFAKAPEGADKTGAAEAAEGSEPREGETTRAPHSLPAPIKAKWAALDPDVRNAFVRLEEGTQAAKGEWAQKAERLNRLDGVLGPRREMLAVRGLDEVQAIQSLFAAQDLLERNPLEGLSYLARSYNVNLAQLAQQTSPQAQGGQQPNLPPAHLQPLMQQVQTLQQQLNAQTQAQEAGRLGEATAQIEAFRNDPAHPYFDNVRPRIKALLESGQASTLADAYEAACWADPEIRPLMVQQHQAATQAKVPSQAERERAARAAQAAGSVTGAPGAAMRPAQGASSGSVLDDLRAAYEQHAA